MTGPLAIWMNTLQVYYMKSDWDNVLLVLRYYTFPRMTKLKLTITEAFKDRKRGLDVLYLLPHIKNAPCLTDLKLYDCDIGLELLEEIHKSCPKINSLKLDGVFIIIDRLLQPITPANSVLTLVLDGIINFDRNIVFLDYVVEKYPKLKHLGFNLETNDGYVVDRLEDCHLTFRHENGDISDEILAHQISTRHLYGVRRAINDLTMILMMIVLELRKSYQSLASLDKEKSVKTYDESKSNFGSGKSNKFFLRKPESEKKALEYWNEYAKDNFERLLQEVKNEGQINSFTSGNTASVQASSIPSDSIVIDLSVKVREVMLIFYDIVLTLENGFQISTLLPEGYVLEGNETDAPPPINQSLLESDTFKSDFKSLFYESHQQIIHAAYYGPRGVTNTTLTDRSYRNAFFLLSSHTQIMFQMSLNLG
ncbi:hypothetical protein K501DRAFT_269692 [Backusella circina FSU 941]|nr:hypothetical protein K501DRAFT_269692 [Backusella circina FSU 941]